MLSEECRVKSAKCRVKSAKWRVQSKKVLSEECRVKSADETREIKKTIFQKYSWEIASGIRLKSFHFSKLKLFV